MVKLFTSRYQNPELAHRPDLIKVGVTLGNPRFNLPYTLADNVKLLAPNGHLFKVSDPALFIPEYRRRLDAHGVEKIGGVLEAIARRHQAGPLVLLCFEDCSVKDSRLVDWCHRLVFGRWWEEQTGERVYELGHEQLGDEAVVALAAFFESYALLNTSDVRQLTMF